MSTHKSIDKICIVVFACTGVATVLLLFFGLFYEGNAEKVPGYETRLFTTDKVHTINIETQDWNSFLESCENEEYIQATVVIDGERYENIGFRAKGNTSLNMVSSSGSERYSFKVEFDRYQDNMTYYGLDKLCLNNLIQDNTYMKDYLVYRLMGEFGVDSPLCSYTYLTVNGEDWGLYLAVEGVEESFLLRNKGTGYGELYKPESMNMARGEEGKMPQMPEGFEEGKMPQMPEGFEEGRRPQMPEGFEEGKMPQMPEGFEEGRRPQMPGDFEEGKMPQMPGGFKEVGMGSNDVKLQYIDDDTDSYCNIFDNAKTNVTKTDKQRFINSLKKLSEKKVEEVVDVEQVLRYFVVHNFVCNYDSYTGSMIHNYYLYEEDGVMSMIPWDYNLAFGSFRSQDASGAVNDPIDTPGETGNEDRPMFDWIMSSDRYTQKYHACFRDFIDDFYITGKIQRMIEETEVLIAPYVEKDPTKFCTYEEFENGTDALLKFCELRGESVLAQLNGTIATTREGQERDASKLIDTSELDLSKLGSMGGGGDGWHDRMNESLREERNAERRTEK